MFKMKQLEDLLVKLVMEQALTNLKMTKVEAMNIRKYILYFLI